MKSKKKNKLGIRTGNITLQYFIWVMPGHAWPSSVVMGTLKKPLDPVFPDRRSRPRPPGFSAGTPPPFPPAPASASLRPDAYVSVDRDCGRWRRRERSLRQAGRLPPAEHQRGGGSRPWTASCGGVAYSLGRCCSRAFLPKTARAWRRRRRLRGTRHQSRPAGSHGRARCRVLRQPRVGSCPYLDSGSRCMW